MLLHKDKKKIARHHRHANTLYYFIIMTVVFVMFFLLHSGYDYDYKIRYADPYTRAVYVIKKVKKIVMNEISIKDKNPGMKYILLWTRTHEPYEDFSNGNLVFEKKWCRWKNCYVTRDRNYLGDYTEFDVILFYGPRLSEILYYYDIPRARHINQKYVYVSVDSASHNPICLDTWDNFFNWTWTYKLNSDSLWNYLVVKNSTGHVIGPKKEMHWLNVRRMDDIDGELKTKLKSKSKLAAIFVSNCNSLSKREEFMREISRELNRYKLSLDVFGSCGKRRCPKASMSRCLALLEKHYYFYFAFENSFSEDYVTEILLHALQHNTVPVVFGGANYSRFMPEGTYLNARELGPKRLAKTMYLLRYNPAAYHMFFRWKKYYSYHYRHESPETDYYCQFCELVNNERLMKTLSVYEKFNIWWSGNDSMCLQNLSLLNNIESQTSGHLNYKIPHINNIK